MAIKFVVKKTDEETPPVEYTFDEQELYTIGRDSSAHLTLYDEDKMVSRLHARLEYDDGHFFLSDLGSRNFTTIGEERLVPGKRYPLGEADVFRVANYEIQLFTVDESPPDLDITVFDQGFSNPFVAPVSDIAQSLRKMTDDYDALPPARKEAALQEALAAFLRDFGSNPVLARIAAGMDTVEPLSVVQVTTDDLEPPDSPQAPSVPGAPPVSSAPGSPPAPSVPGAPLASPLPSTPTNQAKAGPPEGTPVDFSQGSRTRQERIFDLLMQQTSQFVKVPWEFRYEFIGHTFIPSDDTRGLYETDAQGLADFLFDGSASEEELDRRQSLLEDALNEALLHQVAILDGYSSAVGAGTELMIENMDPEKVRTSILNEQPYFKYVPVVLNLIAWSRFVASYSEMVGEDISVLERRTFRPAFIKSYLERITGSQEN